MTSFAVFFDSGVDVLSSSNYDVLLALPNITLESLKMNLGFYLVLGWWGSLAFFSVICWICDSSKMRNQFLMHLGYSLDCSFA